MRRNYWIVIITLLMKEIFLSHICSAQYLERTILLPSSLGGMSNPSCFTYNSINNKVYVGGNNCVIVIDGETDKRLCRIPVGWFPTQLTYNPKSNKVYCIASGTRNKPESTLTVINGATDKIITTLRIGKQPIKLALNTEQNKVYCIAWENMLNPKGQLIIIGGSTDTIIASLDISNYPSDIEYDSINGWLYCAMAETEKNPSNSIWVIDGRNDKIIKIIPLNDNPYDLVLNSIDNKIYCRTGDRDSSISVIDGVTHTFIKKIGISYILDLTWNAHQDKLYCRIWGDNSIISIDCKTDSVIAVIPLRWEEGPGEYICSVFYDMVVLNNRIFFTGSAEVKHAIYEPVEGMIDCYTDQLLYLALGPGGVELMLNPSNKKLYRAIPGGLVMAGEKKIRVGYIPCNPLWNSKNERLFCLHGRNLLSIGLEPNLSLFLISGESRGFYFAQMLYNPIDDKIYLSWWPPCPCYGYSRVTIVDGIEERVLKSFKVAGISPAMCQNLIDDKIYITENDFENPGISVFDGTTDQELCKIPLHRECYNLCWSGKDDKIYAKDSGLVIIDGKSDRVIKYLNIGSVDPSHLIWNSFENEIYAEDSYNDSTIVIDCVSDSIIDGIGISGLPEVNKVENKVYFAESSRDTVLNVIDGSTHQVLNIIPMPGGITDLLYSPISNQLYLMQRGYDKIEDSIIVVDGKQDQITGYIAISGGPSGMAIDTINRRIYISSASGSCIYVLPDKNLSILKTENSPHFGSISISSNPFFEKVKIHYVLPFESMVQLNIYNVSGVLVRTLMSEKKPAGIHRVIWNGRDIQGRQLPAGVYFARLKTEAKSAIAKLVLLH